MVVLSELGQSRALNGYIQIWNVGVASAIVCDGVSAAAVVFAPEYGNEGEHPI